MGLPSRRLIGDYLAIVTLFFGEAFVEFVNNVAPSKLGGPNGIVGIDPYKLFGHQITTNKGYFYLALVLLVLTVGVLHLLDTSRTGRAWRAVREDPLAAGLMTIPVNRVKLMAFSFGAVVAALAGTVFAAQQISVFPTDFDTPFLILIYAGLILGGAGSLGGAVLGGVVIAVTLDGFLRSPTEAGYIFYGVIVMTLIVKLRPWQRLLGVLAATVALGVALHAILKVITASAVSGGPQSGGWIADAVRDFVIVPANATRWGNIGFVVLIVLLITLVQVRGSRADAADPADAGAGRVGVGGEARRRAVDHPPDPDRRDPDRDDERPPAGTAGQPPGGGGVGGAVARAREPDHAPESATAARARQGLAVVRRAARAQRARAERRRARGCQRDRPQRRRQDDGLQRDHRRL